MNTYTFFLTGTHCRSCKIFIEDFLKEFDFIEYINVDLKNEILEIKTINTQNPVELIEIINKKLQTNGYFVSIKRPTKVKAGGDTFVDAVPLGLFFLFLFFLLQKSGILNIGFGGPITPITSFMIGLVASVSSCLAVVGGLVLSLSAKISQDKVSDTKTFILFHLGRIVSFTLLGGLLGILGGAIGLNFTLSAILGILASVIMLILGINLLGIFEKNKITLPDGIFNFFRKIEHKTFTPLIIGFATFFLPCGFTQSMQVVALSSGSFLKGSLIMFAFALGTLPILLFLSFGSTSFAHGKYASLFFKTTGVVVTGLGFFTLLAGLAGLGIIDPLFNI